MSAFCELPFVRGRDFWMVSPTGDWSVDNATGRLHAAAAIELMAAEEAPNLLGSIVRTMIDKGAYTGVEAGFLSAVATAAIQR